MIRVHQMRFVSDSLLVLENHAILLSGRPPQAHQVARNMYHYVNNCEVQLLQVR